MRGIAIAGNDIFLSDYAISRDGQEVAFSSKQPDGASSIWLARLDQRTPPREVARDGEYVSTDAIADTTVDRIVSRMVGREVAELFPKVPAETATEPG